MLSSSSSSNGSHRALQSRSSPHTWLDIDKEDAEDPQACAEYVNDITSYLLQAEVRATAFDASITAVGWAAAIPARAWCSCSTSLCIWLLAGKTILAGSSTVNPLSHGQALICAHVPVLHQPSSKASRCHEGPHRADQRFEARHLAYTRLEHLLRPCNPHAVEAVIDELTAAFLRHALGRPWAPAL